MAAVTVQQLSPGDAARAQMSMVGDRWRGKTRATLRPQCLLPPTGRKAEPSTRYFPAGESWDLKKHSCTSISLRRGGDCSEPETVIRIEGRVDQEAAKSCTGCLQISSGYSERRQNNEAGMPAPKRKARRPPRILKSAPPSALYANTPLGAKRRMRCRVRVTEKAHVIGPGNFGPNGEVVLGRI